MRPATCAPLCRLVLPLFALLSAICLGQGTARADDAPLHSAVEAARKTREEAKLQSLRRQLEQKIAQDSKDAANYLDLGRVNSYLLDVYETKKDKKSAVAAVERAIDSVQHSIQLDDKSADAHSLLADLYGRKISLGTAMFAGPKFGPKAKEENARAMALDNKNPIVWASLGRQYLMAPKMFGGDTAKAIESFQKSLEFGGSQDETWVWLAKAFAKHGDKAKAHDAIQHARSLNPYSPWIESSAASLDK